MPGDAPGSAGRPAAGRELHGGVREARMLDERAPVGTLRVVTDGRTVIDIAAEVTAATGWVPARIS
ncbi:MULTISPECIES: hypothetical protein [Streptomyces]|uniref:Uncharacterized protein n=1 Tax=Streptomyces sviceus (strain ATCC 29083 / DSM 924 / JCM 4929 / NBRC 13980 / NCIMB 11184 / NRRL 5439 / UC 5370) TaxID=463191 RepID=D6XC41_STRX2|nr:MULTISPECIES: hypothetical protein [Streptomyces]EFH28314.1 predicted protein [Streptomyces sviceus ATCC 29083]MYT03732.1 hypothetical protein [Streptomyces sp. SID5470]